MKVWQSYLENKTSGAMRMYWVYGPDQKDIKLSVWSHTQKIRKWCIRPHFTVRFVE